MQLWGTVEFCLLFPIVYFLLSVSNCQQHTEEDRPFLNVFLVVVRICIITLHQVHRHQNNTSQYCTSSVFYRVHTTLNTTTRDTLTRFLCTRFQNQTPPPPILESNSFTCQLHTTKLSQYNFSL